MNKQDILDIKRNFEDRNISFLYFEQSADLLSELKKRMKIVESIGIGNSQTLKHLKVFELANECCDTVFDKTMGNTKEEVYDLKRKSLLTDLYITSSNAVSCDGKIINVDHSGNRVAAMTFGPKEVIVIVGDNKLVKNEQEGLKRALAVATPLNAKRAKYSPPCTMDLPCTNCEQSQRVCNHLSIIRGQHVPNRMAVMVLKGSYGY